jgi:Bardet-Biedl syndrome 1 protein
MTHIKKATQEAKAASCLVIATETGDIYILDTQSFIILHQARVCSFAATPSIVVGTGQYDVDFKIIVATREGAICILKKGWLEGQQIVRLDRPATGLALLPIDQTIVVVCMDNQLLCFSKKGKKLWSITLGQSIVCMTTVTLPHFGINLVCVALTGGQIQLYSQKKFVDQFYAPETVSAMTFGRLGQEDHVLILITIEGTLMIKILKRTAEFSITENIYDNKLTRNQDTSTSLQIPKKSKIFVEQTIRERDNAPIIHNSFQTELWKMRLTAGMS